MEKVCYYTVRNNVLILGERRGMGEVIPGLSLDHRGTERLVKRGWVMPTLVRTLPQEEQDDFYAWHENYTVQLEDARLAVESAAAESSVADDEFDLSDYDDVEVLDITEMKVDDLDDTFGDIDGYPHGAKKSEKIAFLSEVLED